MTITKFRTQCVFFSLFSIQLFTICSAYAQEPAYTALWSEGSLADFEGIDAYQCDLEEEFDFARRRVANDHILRFDNYGHFISGDVIKQNMFKRMNAESLSLQEVEDQLGHMFCEARRLAKFKKSEKVKILIFVHGGLNSFSDTDERFIENRRVDEIVRDSEDWHYPIFVSWPTAAVPTYLEHLLFIREGRRSNFWGPVTSPFVLASDILRTVGRFPATFLYQAINEKDRLASSTFFPDQWLSHSWQVARENICKYDDVACEEQREARRSPTECKDHSALKGPIHLNYSCYQYGGFQDRAARVYSFLTLPVRLTVGSVWHSGISQSAWDNMKRRASNIFYPPDMFDMRDKEGVPGGVFFSELNHRSRNSGDFEVTLVGHSMGAIVLNEALKRHNVDWATTGALKNIVYMAAAASITDTLTTVVPVLRGASKVGTPINFYNMSLNRVAEISELHAFGIIPSGSLLVSIDQHHENPETPLRRTMGSEVNILSSITVLENAFKGTDGAVVLKAFNRCGSRQPNIHGGFGDLAFWRTAFWSLPADGCL